MKRRSMTVAFLLPALIGVVGAGASVGPVELVSVTPGGSVGNADSFDPDLSADGRFVVFESRATDLTADGGAQTRHVYLRDRQGPATELVSKSTSGTPGNSLSFLPSVTPDGRFVVFESIADNLVAGDTNGVRDVFVRDRQSGTTERVSVSGTGAEGDGDSLGGSISDDGRFVAFVSNATNFAAGDTDSASDVFVRDRQSGTTERIIRGLAGEPDGFAQLPQISADGRFVVFVARATNLVAKDTNKADDVFVFDRATQRTERVSVTSSGKQANGDSSNPRICADGRFVVFESKASNLGAKLKNLKVGVFLRDRALNRTEVISVGLKGAVASLSSYDPSVSRDGRVVTFQSSSENLVPNPTGLIEILVRDRQTKTTERASVTNTGDALENRSENPRVSRDGGSVAFASLSHALVVGDSGVSEDVFVRPVVLPPAAPSPVANAGPDIGVPSTGTKTTVQLDGSASSDPQSSPLKYAWMEAGKKIATGPRPKVKLTAGVHAITLVVTDKKHLAGADDLLVTLTQ